VTGGLHVRQKSRILAIEPEMNEGAAFDAVWVVEPLWR
jgi:hypothetical protein